MRCDIDRDLVIGQPVQARQDEGRQRRIGVDLRDAARAIFRQDFLSANQQAQGGKSLADGNYSFERIAYLLADLTEKRSLSIHLPEDRPGSLRALLDVFERHGISISSLHSSRTPAGEVHFRMGFGEGSLASALLLAAQEIDRSGIGRVLTAP